MKSITWQHEGNGTYVRASNEGVSAFIWIGKDDDSEFTVRCEVNLGTDKYEETFEFEGMFSISIENLFEGTDLMNTVRTLLYKTTGKFDLI